MEPVEGAGGLARGAPSTEGGKAKGMGRVVWDLSSPSEAVVEALRRRYPEEVVVPEAELLAESQAWAATAVLAQSLGRRLSLDVVLREVRRRLPLKGEVRGAYLDKGLLTLRFEDPADRTALLQQPWVVAGQTLAVEPWRPGFFPAVDSLKTALVWIRLPNLPVEYWTGGALREILRPAGELHSLDDCTANRLRLGFARACVRLDLSRPLRPGVIVHRPEASFWQSFVFENLSGVCLACGRFHAEGCCSDAPPVGDDGGLPAAKVAQVSTEAVNASEVGPSLGPWVLALRRWAPPAVLPEARPAAGRRLGKEPVTAAGCGVLPAAGGWISPAKVARRRPPPRPLGPAAASSSPGSKGPRSFSILASLRPDGTSLGAEVIEGDGVQKGFADVAGSARGKGKAADVAPVAGLTKSPASPSPEIPKGPRRKNIFQVAEGVSDGLVLFQPRPSTAKRARSEEDAPGYSLAAGSVPRGGGRVSRGGGHGNRGGGRPKIKSAASSTRLAGSREIQPVETDPQRLFVFEAGLPPDRASLLEPSDMGEPSAASMTLDASVDHDAAVALVKGAIRGPDDVSSAMPTMQPAGPDGREC